MTSRIPSRFGLAAILALLSLSGCVARYVRISEKGMTCAEAHQVAINSIARMGYTLKDVTKPAPGSPGVVIGERYAPGQPPQGEGADRVFAQVFCTTVGSEVEVKAEGPALSNLNFRNEFEQTFNKIATTKAPTRAAAESGVDVLVKPERADDADLGVDLATTGLLPVKVRITNNTKRTYRFKVSEVVLRTTTGKGVEPVALSSLAGKLSSGSSATLGGKMVRDATLQPGAALSGYLLFPFDAYERARVTLEDIESKEEEGFSIEL